ncbi:uncharacterized protein PAM68-like [Solanum dulcamara]|uniref:uncharacterized protein PAM68-like n=1 Tax=Solanum dulcamara TaxID=45834 RepID=UPI0024863094|nr:uncharacterized protein PAM68-like [Solanum dulcamara]
METLIGLQNPYLFVTNSFPPLNKKIPIHFHKNINRIPNIHRTTWKLNAEAKGFGNGKLETSKKDNRRNNNDDNDEKIPTEIWERIIGRILFYVGAPLVGGVILLQIIDIIKQQKLLDLPIWLPFLTTFITFGASALGAAYGTLSASWDPEKQGSFIGLEEAQKNWVDMWAEDGADDEEENRWIN